MHVTVCYRRSHFSDDAWSRTGRVTRAADSEGDLRASDADRERVASQLREHAGAGRLSVDELSERLELVFAARTLGELARPLADLPRTERHRRLGRLAQTPMLGLAVLLVVIWAVTGAATFWPVWVLLGLWWFGLLGRRHPWAHDRRSVV